MKFYHERWRNSERVQTMTAEERGIYITLPLMQPILGSLPDDPCLLARMTGLAEEELARAFPRVRAMFREVEIDGQKRLVNDAMAEILEKTHETFARGGKACARKFGVSAKKEKSILPDA